MITTTKSKDTAVGGIGNYYGGLTVRKTGDAYAWSIENWDGHGWEEIPAYLGEALLKFERARLRALKQKGQHND